MNKFPSKLKRTRQALKLSVLNLSLRASIKPSVLYHYEAGTTSPNTHNLMRICKALNVTPNDLLL